MEVVARIRDEDPVSRAQLPILQMSRPRLPIEVELTQGPRLLLRSAMIVKDVDASDAVNGHGLGAVLCKEEDLTGEPARWDAAQTRAFGRLPDGEDLNGRMLGIGRGDFFALEVEELDARAARTRQHQNSSQDRGQLMVPAMTRSQ